MDIKLLIVESPTKARTLERFLSGKGYNILSSNGHIIDLPKSKLSVDLKNDFKPTYDIIKGKSKIVKAIKKAAKEASQIFLATDPDREGEAIAYHITQVIDERKDTTPPFFTLKETIQVINSVLDALTYAHKTTIHRDIC